MQFFVAAAAIALLAGAQAKTCVNQTVSVTVSARQGTFNIAIPGTNLEVVDFVLNSTKTGSNFTNVALTGYDTVSGTYNISTQFCTPNSGSGSNPVVQILTHGIGFDKTYWDLPFDAFKYSYLNVATDKYKFSTLSYDRLGVGKSSKGEPLNEIQAPIEVAVLHALTTQLRSGTFPGVKTAFKKVVHVGHSFGSGQTYSLASMYPADPDAIVLTGFSLASQYMAEFLAGGSFEIASLNQPLRFGSATGAQIQNLFSVLDQSLLDYLAPIDLTTLPAPEALPKGYLVSATAANNKLQFLKPGFFDPAILTLAERTKQTVTVGELLTVGSISQPNKFAGPVFVVTGDSDVPFCGGACLIPNNFLSSSIPMQVKSAFPSVSAANFSTLIQPNTGHGINLHYNATGAYEAIQQFLIAKGLQSS